LRPRRIGQGQGAEEAAEDRAAVLDFRLDARRLVVMGPAKPRTDLELRRDLGGDVTEDVEGAGPRKAGLLLALGGLEVGGNALRDQRVQSVARRRGDSLQQRAGEKR